MQLHYLYYDETEGGLVTFVITCIEDYAMRMTVLKAFRLLLTSTITLCKVSLLFVTLSPSP